jgi:hypothetical protein
MNVENTEALPHPPQLIQSLISGFDAITNHFGLIFFPIILDIFLWLGPRLRIYQIVTRFFQSITSMPGMEAPDVSELVKINRDLWFLVAKQLNLFSILRTFPVGIPSLMVSIQPTATPRGPRLDWEITSVIAILIILGLLTLIGLLFGSVYFWAVAQATLTGGINWVNALRECLWACWQVVVLYLAWLALLVVLSVPVSCLLSVFTFGGVAGGNIGLFLAGGLLVWLIFPLIYSPHGIFVSQIHVWKSISTSLRLVRFTFSGTAMLFLSVVLLSEGLDILWKVPPDTSWLTLIGLAGHGFISTGLLASTFIYYRDANQWVDQVAGQIKRNTILS